MDHLPTKPCEGCKKPTTLRIRRTRRWWPFGRWHWSCPKCAPVILEVNFTK